MLPSRNKKDNSSGHPVNHTEVARIIFAAAESMGMADRQQVERLTSQVIERLEQQQQPLPGMEDLLPKPRHQPRRLPTGAEIEAMVKEILNAEKQAKHEEVQPEMKTTVVKTEVQHTTEGINVTENARRVLERR